MHETSNQSRVVPAMRKVLEARPYAGIPDASMLGSIRQTALFRDMEQYSDSFLKLNMSALAKYRKVSDPFHSWSRRWEYPYCYSRLASFIQPSVQTSVLDAGSGWTFFPFYITQSRRGTKVHCCDSDPTLGVLFNCANRSMYTNVAFERGDIIRLAYPDCSFDIVYCISVLEHLEPGDRNRALSEFRRVLRNGGLLALTFDISLSGSTQIPVDEAERLLLSIKERFHPEGEYSLAEALTCPNLLTGPRHPIQRVLITGRQILRGSVRENDIADFLRNKRRNPTSSYAPSNSLTIFAGSFIKEA